MKTTHREKVRIARGLRSREDIKMHIPIFQTKGWTTRRESLAKKQHATRS